MFANFFKKMCMKLINLEWKGNFKIYQCVFSHSHHSSFYFIIWHVFDVSEKRRWAGFFYVIASLNTIQKHQNISTFIKMRHIAFPCLCVFLFLPRSYHFVQSWEEVSILHFLQSDLPFNAISILWFMNKSALNRAALELNVF